MYEKKYHKYKNKYLTFKYKTQSAGNSHLQAKTYLTHDNGGRPFKCIILDKNTIQIYRQSYDTNSEDKYDDNPSLTFKPKHIFIGKSPLNKMTKCSGGHGPEFDGNTYY